MQVMTEQQAQEIPGVTRPFTFNEAAIEARNLVDLQIAQGLPPQSIPISFKDPAWPSPDGKGVIYWDPKTNRHVVTAHDRSNVKSGATVSTSRNGW